jgi:prepilin-type N-terminal cleavage/methylation domain-containing protein
MLFRTNLKDKRGFTAIELLVVIVVILGLLLIVGPRIFSLIGKGNVAAATQQLDGIIKAIAMYYGENKKHPKTWTDLVSNGYLETTPDASWSINCTNGGNLAVTYTAGDQASTLDTEWDKRCSGGASVTAGTSDVKCIITSSAYCP